MRQSVWHDRNAVGQAITHEDFKKRVTRVLVAHGYAGAWGEQATAGTEDPSHCEVEFMLSSDPTSRLVEDLKSVGIEAVALRSDRRTLVLGYTSSDAAH